MKGSEMSSRSILNFEASLHYAGEDPQGNDRHEIQLMVNHHVFYRWSIDGMSAAHIRANRAVLDSLVAAKMFEVFHREES